MVVKGGIKMKTYFTCLCIALMSTSMILATSKTLPKGVFKIDAYNTRYNVDTLGANPSGDKETWEKVSLNDGQAKHIYLLTYFSEYDPSLGLNMDTKLAHSWKKSKVHLDVAYGITDKITMFTAISYERALLDYTDEYVKLSKIIDGSALGQTAGYKRVPDKAESDHLNDTFIGLKYNLGKFSAAYKGTFGFLKTGNDSEEKTYEDGVQELETSRGYDQHHLYVFKDVSIKTQLIELTGGYIYLGEMTQIFLDNSSVKFNPGDMFLAKVNVPVTFKQYFTLNTSITSIYHQKDKYKDGNSAFLTVSGTKNPAVDLKKKYTSWTTVPKSSGTTHLAKIELLYQPKIFIRVFINANTVLSNDISGQLYNFPGRLQPGTMWTFGMTLFGKVPQ